MLATANQSAAFCDRIGMLTLLGSKDSHEEFIREKLNPKIDTSFLYMAGARTIVKRRMVETYPFQKLFEVYFMDQEVPEAVNKASCTREISRNASPIRRGGRHRLRPRHADARDH